MAILTGVRFPTEISYGSRGFPKWRNTVVELDSGASQRVQRWGVPRRTYDARYGLRNLDDFQSVRDLWYVAVGSLNGFRFKDPTDFTTKPAAPDKHTGAPFYTDYQIGTGNGTQTQFQLVKRYTFGAYESTQIISKPVAGTVRVAFSSTEQLSGWTVDPETGIVTFTSAPANGTIINAGCEFDIPVQFAPSMDADFNPTLSSFKAIQAQSILLEEMLGDVTTPARHYYGGSNPNGPETISETTALSWAWGATVVLEPTVASKILLPNPANLDGGGPYHIVQNSTAQGSFTLTFRTHDDVSTVFSLTAGQQAIDYVYIDGSSNKQWGGLVV